MPAANPRANRSPRFDDILVLHISESGLPAEWRRLVRACRLGHLGEVLDAVQAIGDPVAQQVAADAMLLHGRPDLAAAGYEALLALASGGGPESPEIALRAGLGFAAASMALDSPAEAERHAEGAMDACFALAVHDDMLATGHALLDFGDYIGRFPLQATARAMADLPAIRQPLRARLLHFLFLAGGCEDKALLQESFDILQAPEQFFWIAQERYRCGDVAGAIELEFLYAAYARERGGHPQVCCGALGDETPNDNWAASITLADGQRLLDMAVPLVLKSRDPALAQAVAPFFVTGGVDLLKGTGRLLEIVAIVDRLDAEKPTYDCGARTDIIGLRRHREEALALMRSAGPASPGL